MTESMEEKLRERIWILQIVWSKYYKDDISFLYLKKYIIEFCQYILRKRPGNKLCILTNKKKKRFLAVSSFCSLFIVCCFLNSVAGCWQQYDHCCDRTRPTPGPSDELRPERNLNSWKLYPYTKRTLASRLHAGKLCHTFTKRTV